jgi:hypothetical protein
MQGGGVNQMNRQPDSTEDTEALRQEIQAAIAAGRELDPEMDKHLADSVLDRYRQEQAARQRAAASAAPRNQSLEQQPSPAGEIAQIVASNISGTIAGVVGIAALIVILILKPDFWWLIFLFPGIFFGWSRRARREGYYRGRRRIDGGQGEQASSSGQSNLNPPIAQSSRDVEIL